MENENNQNEAVKEQQVKTKKSKLPIIIIVAVLLIVAVFACLYFFTDLFKSKTQVFAEKLTTKQSVQKQIEESRKLAERMEKESYKSETKLTLDVGNDLEYLAKKNLGIDLSKLEIEVNDQSDTKDTESNITAKYNNKNIITIDTIQKDNLIGLRVKDLYSKYVTLENENLKNVFEKFGVTDTSSIPNKLLTSKDIRNAITITEKDMDKIEKKYSKVISDSIKSKDVEEEKDVTIEVSINDETKKLNTKKSTITINEKEALELTIDIVKEAKNDSDTLKLIADNYNSIINLYEDTGYDIYAEKLEVSDIKDALKDLQEELEDELESYKDQSSNDLEKMDISLYEYKNEIIKTEISVEDFKYAFTCYAEKEDSYIDFSMKDTYYDPAKEIKIYVNGKTKEDRNKITSEGVIGIKDNSQIDAKIKFNQTIEFGADVKITDLNSSNSLNINNLATSDLDNILTEIEKNAQTYAMKLYMSFPQEIDKISELMNSNSQIEDNPNDLYSLNPMYSEELLEKVEDSVEDVEKKVQEQEETIDELERLLDAGLSGDYNTID